MKLKKVKKKIWELYDLKTSGIIENLRSWKPRYWLFFFGIIPLILVFVGALPYDIKKSIFILNISHDFQFSFLLHAYVHSELVHLCGNLAFYLISMIIIFMFCKDSRFLYYTIPIFLLILPVICSLETIYLFAGSNNGCPSQGFSAVVQAYLAMGLYFFIQWPTQQLHKMKSHSWNTAGKIGLGVVYLLIAFATVWMMIMIGFNDGLLKVTDGQLVNGVAHMIGFLIGIFSAVLLDLFWLKKQELEINLFSLFGAVGLFLFYFFDYLPRQFL